MLFSFSDCYTCRVVLMAKFEGLSLTLFKMQVHLGAITY